MSHSPLGVASALEAARGASGVAFAQMPHAIIGAACGLTPPSSGRAKGRFAPFGPPLMSNVRAHEAWMC